MNDIKHFQIIESYIPYSSLGFKEILIIAVFIFSVVLVRYIIFSGLAYLFFWKKNLTVNSLHDLKIKSGQISYEIKWSVISSLIFAAAGTLLAWLWMQSYTEIYLKFDEYGFWYLPVSFIIYSLAHEIYFYLTHVWMHKPKVFAKVHAVHHYSKKVSPWASFSFHPLEALIQAAFLPITACIIPIHPVVIVIYLMFMTLSAVSNHLGFEIISARWITSWFVSGTHHAIHHDKFNSNYGLYYCFMDKIFKTEFKSKELP